MLMQVAAVNLKVEPIEGKRLDEREDRFAEEAEDPSVDAPGLEQGRDAYPLRPSSALFWYRTETTE
jgi:hypothetical protein